MTTDPTARTNASSAPRVESSISGFVDAVETHVSVLYFLGDRVYKLRKPVKFGFLDFSDRAEREADCHREVILNRRYAPDVYLGVYDIEENGTPVDHLVVMRRLPAASRLSHLVTAGSATDDHIAAVVESVIDADATADRSSAIDEFARSEALLSAWSANIEELAPYVGTILDSESDARIQSLAYSYLKGRSALLERRIKAGRIRDGHGDLRAEDIFCLADGPRILDCIEFDDRLRYGDILADLAFLAMDLEYFDAPDLAQFLIEAYKARTGDRFPSSLAYHYCAARAYVRSKVSCLAAAEGLPGAQEEARSFHDLALSFLERARVKLTLVGGLPGTGKSTLASFLAPVTGSTLLRSDVIRKELGSSPKRSNLDLYGAEMTNATYETMLSRARDSVENGESVLLDASWSSEGFRALARKLAHETASELLELKCVAPRATSEARIERRRRQGTDPSDATIQVAREMAAQADPWPGAVTIDNSGPLPSSEQAALLALHGE